ncbi:site-specific integrase, partial [Lacticaseibacillus paracasei]|nr:site-specific integrase [Lacticaseibacillus paracasei]
NSFLLRDDLFIIPSLKSCLRNQLTSIRKQFKEFNKYFINNIAPVDIQKWQIMMKNQVSNSYTRLVQCLLSLVFDRAIVLGFCEENPIKFVGN